MGISRLTWGVKASFRSYVEAAEGSITLTDGATRAEDGSFVFRAVPGGDLDIAPDGSATGAMRFEGTVTFAAHSGMLSSTITELGVEAGNEGLILTGPGSRPNQDRCTLAKLGPVEVSPDGVVVLGSKITLDGMFQIADNYPPGTALDPVQLD